MHEVTIQPNELHCWVEGCIEEGVYSAPEETTAGARRAPLGPSGFEIMSERGAKRHRSEGATTSKETATRPQMPPGNERPGAASSHAVGRRADTVDTPRPQPSDASQHLHDCAAPGSHSCPGGAQAVPEAAPTTPAIATLVHKARGGTLVRCLRQHMCSTHPGNEDLEINPYIDVPTNKTFRRMSWGVLLARPEASLTHMWTQLATKIKVESKGMAMIMAATQSGYAALLFKGAGNADKEVHAGSEWQAYKLSSKDPLPFAKALRRSAEVIFTITLQEQEQMARVTALEAIQPHMKMDEIAFKAHLTDLKEQKRLGQSLCAEADFLVNHPKDMEKLKELLMKKERMRSMLKDVDSTLRFPWDFVITRDTVTVFRISPIEVTVWAGGSVEVSRSPADPSTLSSILLGCTQSYCLDHPARVRLPAGRPWPACIRAAATRLSSSRRKPRTVSAS